MQPLICVVERALTKFGTANAASKPMIATTIMISINVNPALSDDVLFFIANLSFGLTDYDCTGAKSRLPPVTTVLQCSRKNGFPATFNYAQNRPFYSR